MWKLVQLFPVTAISPPPYFHLINLIRRHVLRPWMHCSLNVCLDTSTATEFTWLQLHSAQESRLCCYYLKTVDSLPLRKSVYSKSLRNNTKLTQDVDWYNGLCGHYHLSTVTTLSPSAFSSPAVHLNLPLSYLSVFHFSLQYTVLNTHKKWRLPILCLVFC